GGHCDRRLRRSARTDPPRDPAALLAHDRHGASPRCVLGRDPAAARAHLQRLPAPAHLRAAHGRQPLRLRRARRALPLGKRDPTGVRPGGARVRAPAHHPRRTLPAARRGAAHPPLGRAARGAAGLACGGAVRPGDPHRVGGRLRGRRALDHQPGGAHARRAAERGRHAPHPTAVGRSPLPRLGGGAAALPRRQRGPRRDDERRPRGAPHPAALPRRPAHGAARRPLTRCHVRGAAVNPLRSSAVHGYRGRERRSMTDAPVFRSTYIPPPDPEPDRPRTSRWFSALILLLLISIAIGVGVLGSLATGEHVDGWYADADKPAWTPPGVVFGPVWTVLYATMA